MSKRFAIIIICLLIGTGVRAQGPREGVDYVDLGLTSGTLWATRNVGAVKVADYGGYYAWGETKEKDRYYWSTYFDSVGGSSSKFSEFGSNSKTSIIGTEHDAATAVMGWQWKMPTLDQWQELKDECTWTQTPQPPKGGESTAVEVYGYTLTGPNGNTIFVPSAGSKYGTETLYQGKYFYYWAGELYCMYDDAAGSHLGCYMDDSFVNSFAYYGASRYYGYPIRAVYDPEAERPVGDINGDGHITITDATLLIDILKGHTTWTGSTSYLDIDKNGKVDAEDVKALIKNLLVEHGLFQP